MKTLAHYLALGITFRPFNESDWQCFSGCETENPIIGFAEDDDICIVVDGDHIEVCDADGWVKYAELVGG